MPDHRRKVTDDHKTWTQSVTDNSTALNDGSVNSVDLYMEAPDGTTAVNGASVTVVDGTTFEYTFSTGELNVGGNIAEIHVEYTSTTEILPPGDHYDVQVEDDIQ